MPSILPRARVGRLLCLRCHGLRFQPSARRRRRVEAGEELEILHNNRPVAKLVPLHIRRQWIPATEILARVGALGPDQTGRSDDKAVGDLDLGVSVITLGELRLGVVNARPDPEVAARRLATYVLARQLEPMPIDERVSDAWALLVARLRAEGRKVPVNDSWIAATAIAHDVPVATQDNDYDAMPGLSVIKL